METCDAPIIPHQSENVKEEIMYQQPRCPKCGWKLWLSPLQWVGGKGWRRFWVCRPCDYAELASHESVNLYAGKKWDLERDSTGSLGVGSLS